MLDLSILEGAGLCADTFAQAAIPVEFHVEDPGPSPLVITGERLDGLRVDIDGLVQFGVRERLVTTPDVLELDCTPPPPAVAARTLALAVVSDFHLVWPNLTACSRMDL